MALQLLVGAIMRKATRSLAKSAVQVGSARVPNMNVEVVVPDSLRRNLEGLSASIERGGLRRTLRKASTPVARTLRKNMPVRTGASKRSVATKVKVHKGLSGYGVVGVASGKKFPDPRRKAGVHMPSKIFHLIERGHRTRGGRGYVPGKFPLRRAWDANKSRAEEIMRRDLERDIRLEWARRMKARTIRESASARDHVAMQRIARRITRY